MKINRILYVLDTFFFKIFERPSRVFKLIDLKYSYKIFISEYKSKKTLSPRQYKNLIKDKQKAFDNELWVNKRNMYYKKFESYDQYIHKQKGKFEKLNHVAFDQRQKIVKIYTNIFKKVKLNNLKPRVICLAARGGEEVEAFRNLGFFCYGIDLNSGKENEYVLYGDFHNLNLANNSADLVYSNSLDHSFELKKIIDEVHRVLDKDGIFLCDILKGYKEGFLAGDHDTTHWNKARDLAEYIKDTKLFDLKKFSNLEKRGRKDWYQALFRVIK